MPTGIYKRKKQWWSWNRNKKGVYSRETIKKMREAKLRNPPKNLFKSGKKHPNWKGGSSSRNERIKIWKTSEYKLWRISVFERDNWTCIWCGQKGGKLNADHIKPWSLFPELRFAIDNGRTLCFDCHKKTDTWGNRIKNYVQKH